MGTIYRRLPNSNLSRQAAIARAKLKYDSMPPTNEVLRPSTVTRLNHIASNYPSALQEVANANAALNSNTKAKEPLVGTLQTFVSHFIQVFNLGVARGKYPAAHRSFYHLDVESSALPDMQSEANIMLWAQRIISGDGARVTAGGAAMANPEVGEVIDAEAPAVAAITQQTVLAEALDTEQEQLEELNEEVDADIKRIWDEVESFYGNETAESKRQNAREWGVVYISEGPAATLTGLVKTAAGAAVEGATVTVVETGSEATTNNEGRYSLNTTVTGSVTVRAALGANSAETTVEIPEEHDGVEIEVGEMVVG